MSNALIVTQREFARNETLKLGLHFRVTFYLVQRK